MTTGYLWTGQYEECKSVIEQGKPQSMELDEESLEGHWSTNSNTGMDFFIINDAIFSKLCILGDDVEPCFEGSRITANEVSKTFTKMDDGFKQTLYTMMQDLKFALEGGQKMDIDKAETLTTENKESEVVESTEAVSEEEVAVEETPAAEDVVAEETSEEEKDNEEQSVLAENEISIEDQSSQENFTKADDKDEEEESKDADDSKEDSESEEDDEDKEKDYKCGGGSSSSKENKKKKSYSLLETELAETKAAYADLEQKYQSLVEFKNQIDNEKKDALIKSFYMLSDEDKEDVIANKSNYSLDEIEAKLSVICVRKKVNFDLDDTSKNEEVEDTVVTYTMNNNEGSSTPAWIAALKNTRNSKK